ncbi:hypothetical protein FB451DRAFT_1191315 [Mycena latifolia]|nr:hypothetical protein FB451DRAFT_1191315 [Mycena latifolia]
MSELIYALIAGDRPKPTLVYGMNPGRPSVTCQKSDWARHKKICGKIQSVSWPEADETQCKEVTGDEESSARKPVDSASMFRTNTLFLSDGVDVQTTNSLYIIGPVEDVLPFLQRSGRASHLLGLTLKRCTSAVQRLSVLQQTSGLTSLSLNVHWPPAGLVAAFLISFATPRARSLADFDDALSRDAFTDMVLSRCGDASGTGVRPLQIWAGPHEECGIAYLRGQWPGSCVFERDEGKTRGGEFAELWPTGLKNQCYTIRLIKISMVYDRMTIRT